MTLNGALLESACCESEDYTAVARAVEVLGLSAFENVNCLEAAKRVVSVALRLGATNRSNRTAIRSSGVA